MVYVARHSLASYFYTYLRWSLRCRFGRDIQGPGECKATAILVGYRRLGNMEALVRACLRCTWIEKIIVINNNAHENIGAWVRVQDARLTLINAGENKGAMERYRVACHEPGTYFFSVDDDIFLSPEQLTALFSHLLADPSVPHGIFGQMWLGAHATHPGHSFKNCIIEFDGIVDILNRVYFFTRTHAERCISLAKGMGYDTPESLALLSALDDVLLSWSGQGKPRCHNVGAFIDCPTQAKPGIAQWMEKNFTVRRRDLFVALQERSERTDLQRE